MESSVKYNKYFSTRRHTSYYGLINSKNEYAQIRISHTDKEDIRVMIANKIKILRRNKCRLRKLSYDEFYSNPTIWDWRCVMQQHMREM